MLEHERIDVSEGIDPNRSNESKECDICYYCQICHDLMQKAINFNDIAVVSIKRSDYRIHFSYMSKSDAINLLNNFWLDNKRVLSWILVQIKHLLK